MATALEIANQALLRVGAEPITALSDDTERARACNQSWDFVRREVLRSHSWNANTTRALLTAYAPEPLFGFVSSYAVPSDALKILEVQTETNYDDWRREGDKILTDRTPAPTLETALTPLFAPSAANPVVISITAHGFSDGDVVKVTGTGMTEVNDRFFAVTNATAGTISLQDEDGTGRTVSTDNGSVARVSQGDLKVRYLRDITTIIDGSVDAHLEELLALRLAVEIVERVTDSTTKRQALLAEYGALLDEAMMDDGEEQSPAEFEEDDWILARHR